MKIALVYHVRLEREVPEDVALWDFSFRNKGPPIVVTEANVSDILPKLDSVVGKIKEKMALWVNRGSGWKVVRINSVYLDSAHYVQRRGGTYEPLPLKFRRKQAIINIKSRDNDCLR